MSSTPCPCRRPALRFGSLFAGIGGFDLGLEGAGMECAWQVEIDDGCRSVLSRHWPAVERYEDVRDVGREELRAVDLVCGGFPCQDLSVAGRRAGLDGERSGLWWEFARVIEELRPRWVVIENVPGLLSSGEGRDMGILCGTLAQLGYGWAYRVLDAQFFGVAQRRRRVFVVGCLGDGARAAKVLFEPESGARDTPPGRQAGADAAGTLTERLGRYSSPRGDGADNIVVAPLKAAEPSKRNGGSNPTAEEFIVVPQTVVGTLVGSGAGVARPGGKAETDFLVCDEVAATLQSPPNGPRYNAGDEILVCGAYTGYNGADDNDAQAGHLVVGALQAHSPAHGHEMTSQQAAESGHLVVGSFCENQRGELRVSGQVQGLSTDGGKPGQGYPAALTACGVRRLTPTECERLQGFPGGWTAVGAEAGELSDSARYRMLGNAVCVPVVEWIGRRIMEVAS